MGEAILTRFGAVQDPNTPKLEWKLVTEIFTENTQYTIPSCRNQELTVMLFGGGGGVNNIANGVPAGGGGGGGYMNKAIVEIPAGGTVQITIGSGGATKQSGGTTSFGTYLSANGGQAGRQYDGGNGGAGGGGAGYFHQYMGNGGNGESFGGGGSVTGLQGSRSNRYLGHGGEYGGEGGGAMAVGYSSGYFGDFGIYLQSTHTGVGKSTLLHGGPNSSIYPFIVDRETEDGVPLDPNNTELIMEYDKNLLSYSGLHGENSVISNNSNGFHLIGLGGGGGIGGCGGKGNTALFNDSFTCYGAAAGGGGGGYGKANYGHGSNNALNGNNGVCIVQYRQLVFL